jgi:DNA-binding LytR/AlgR family response regulator
MKIAICDDEKKICSELESTLIQIFKAQNIRADIDVYFTTSELHEEIESGLHYDLIFLDILFKEKKMGIDVGKYLRDTMRNNITAIVYISREQKFAMELFDTRPMNFLIKPFASYEVEKVVNMYLKMIGPPSNEFVYKAGNDVFRVQKKDIVYFESFGRKLTLNLSDGRKVEFYGSLAKVFEEQLESMNFLFIHMSYIVNYDYIISMGYEQITLANSLKSLPISRGKRKEVRKKFFALRDQLEV